jgi:hypothetical protein
VPSQQEIYSKYLSFKIIAYFQTHPQLKMRAKTMACGTNNTRASAMNTRDAFTESKPNPKNTKELISHPNVLYLSSWHGSLLCAD